MAKPAIQITHESEAQRQHIRLHMPSMVEIEGHAYPVADISAGGMAVHDIDRAFRKGARLTLLLTLPFDHFSLGTSLEAEVLHIDKKKRIAGFRFVDPAQIQHALLRHVMRAYIGGDVVAANDLLHVAARDNTAPLRTPDTPRALSTAAILRGSLFYACLIAAAATIVWFAAENILRRVYTVTTPHGTIVTGHHDLAAPAAGLYVSALPSNKTRVAKGDVLGSIAPAFAPSSLGVTIKSPCDCLVAQRHLASGLYTAEGANLLTLVPLVDDVTVQALVPQDRAHKIHLGSIARMVIAGDGRTIEGSVTDIRSSERFIADAPGMTSAPAVAVTITPESDDIDPALSGRPVFVEINL